MFGTIPKTYRENILNHILTIEGLCGNIIPFVVTEVRSKLEDKSNYINLRELASRLNSLRGVYIGCYESYIECMPKNSPIDDELYDKLYYNISIVSELGEILLAIYRALNLDMDIDAEDKYTLVR